MLEHVWSTTPPWHFERENMGEMKQNRWNRRDEGLKTEDK
jgi:hypothetical protein